MMHRSLWLVARLLGLGYPAVQRSRRRRIGGPQRFPLPKVASRPEGGFYPYDFFFRGP